MTRDDGKDEDSAVAVQLLNDGRLAAEGTVVDVDFDDQSVSARQPRADRGSRFR
jgi:hypothetical protein